MAERKTAGIFPGLYRKLANEIREINISNGWNVPTPEDWESEDKIPRAISLIHSEISEAWEARHNGDRANFLEELADVGIRILDCIGCWDCVKIDVILDERRINQPTQMSTLASLHCMTSQALELFRDHRPVEEFAGRLLTVYAECERISAFHGACHMAEVYKKLAKNMKRRLRHGNKKV